MTVTKWVVRGAEVIDGTGAPRRFADVAVADGRIAAVLDPGEAAEGGVLDGTGLVLCPGFIDSHTHDDKLALDPAAANPKLLQGVTSVVTGNCGISLAPLVAPDPPPPLDILGADTLRFGSFGEYLHALDAARPALNVAPLLGHTSLRVRHVADLSRDASRAERHAMANDVRDALAAGAIGLSTGVFYPPARAASTEELLDVCAPLRGSGAVLAMHIRDESDHVDTSVREALQVGKASDVQLVLSHHKVVGPRNHGRTKETLAMVEAAAREQSVCLDCYPYEASSTMLDPERAARIGNVMVSWSRPYPQFAGRTLKSIAGDWGVDIAEAARRLLPGGAIYFGMAAQDVERVLAHPMTMVGSDGLPHDAAPHPRLWGTFPRVLGHYSRDRHLFPLEAAVHKMTGLPARIYGLHGRGVIAPGAAADLVLLDPATVIDRATYAAPTQAPAGIRAVWVNGRLAVQDGQQHERHAGRRLQRKR